MSKFFTAAALALAFFCASDVAAAAVQTSNVRVGPDSDDRPAPAPQKTEKKPAESDAAKNARRQEQKQQPKPEQKNDPANGSAKNGTRDAQTPSVASSTTTAPPSSTDSSTTSDAPPKTGPAAPVPVAPPEKNGRTEAGGDGAAAKTPPSTKPDSSTKSDPAPSSAATNTATPGGATNRPAAPAASSASSAPLTSIYRIGVGDVLDVRLLNLPDGRQSTLFTVLAGGVLEYPLLRDPVTAAGMTTDELAAQLVAELRHRGVYDRPQVRVGVREYASHAVLVSGLVNDPGTKILRREAIPLYVVVAEAQPKPEAGRAVVFSHATGKTTNVDLNDAAAMGMLVQQGDVVNLVVRPPEFFYIGGEINAPGQKDFHTGMTLTQAVLASGGVTRLAGGRVKVSRQGADGRLVSTDYVLQEIENGFVPDPPIRAGDRIEVSRGKK